MKTGKEVLNDLTNKKNIFQKKNTYQSINDEKYELMVKLSSYQIKLDLDFMIYL